MQIDNLSIEKLGSMKISGSLSLSLFKCSANVFDVLKYLETKSSFLW